MLNFGFYVTMVLFVAVCTIMILLILIQKGRGGGLASAFGGGGANTAFGSKTGDVLTWATSVVFGVFLVLAVALNLMADRMTNAATRVPTPAVVTPVSPGPNPVPAAPPTTTPSQGARPSMPDVAPTTQTSTNPS